VVQVGAVVFIAGYGAGQGYDQIPTLWGGEKLSDYWGDAIAGWFDRKPDFSRSNVGPRVGIGIPAGADRELVSEFYAAVGAGQFERAGRILNEIGFKAATQQGHHGIPKFLGGFNDQDLTKLDPKIHAELHAILRENLKAAGIPLPVGGPAGSAEAWAQYFQFNPGAQRAAFDAVLDASRVIDAKYGTTVTQDVWRNLTQGNFTPYP